MKKISIFIVFSLLVCAFLFWKFQSPNTKYQKDNLHTIKIGSQALSVEVAQSIPEITLGLGQRDTLGSDGMLFVMPDRSIPTFWMKDMRFDLDFVWIDSDRVVDVTENVSAQRGESDPALRIYSPKAVVTHVLEMNSGEVRKRGIKIGDAISY